MISNLVAEKYSLREILLRSNIVQTYDDLIKELKRQGLSPRETYDLIIKQRLKFHKISTRTLWMLEKINMYLKIRKKEAISILLKEIKLITAKGGIVLTRDRIKTLKRIVIERNLMPSKKNSCENAVNNTEFKTRWALHNGRNKIKWDPRKETQNLQKIVTEKKFDRWFLKDVHPYIYDNLSKYKLDIKGKEQNFINTIR